MEREQGTYPLSTSIMTSTDENDAEHAIRKANTAMVVEVIRGRGPNLNTSVQIIDSFLL
jgi:hypothetical protein